MQEGSYKIKGELLTYKNDKIYKHKFPMEYEVYFSREKTTDYVLDYSLKLLNNNLKIVVSISGIKRFYPLMKPTINIKNNNIIITYYHTDNWLVTYDYESYSLSFDDHRIKAYNFMS